MAYSLRVPICVGDFSVEIDSPSVGVYFTSTANYGSSDGEKLVSVSKSDSSGNKVQYMRDFDDNFFVYSGSQYLRAPSSYNFGTISGDTEVPFLVWNSSSHDVQLNAMTVTGTSAESVSFNPALATKLYKSGESKYTTMLISGDGSEPSISAAVAFDFDVSSGVRDWSFTVSALRIALFAFQPDFSESAKITLSTATNIIKKLDGSEQRINLQQGIARSYTFKFTTRSRKDSSRLKAFLHKNAGKQFAAPYWIDAQQISATAGDTTFNFATPGFVDFSKYTLFAIIDSVGNYELMQVAGYTSDSVSSVQQCVRNYTNAVLVPCEICYLDEGSYKVTEFTSENLSATLTFDTFVN